MSCLPRLKPERFYDLVAQVAIIRPGPIVGNMLHPYLQRRQGREPVRYPHPALRPALERTLGVPLFQEQLLRISMIAAGFSGGEAEELRRAFSHKRSERKMQDIEQRLRGGMEKNGIVGAPQDEIVGYITSFAQDGFPESHAASFALIAYASAYLKCHYLAAFTAAILNNQPMGFYSPATLVKDAQRHGLKVKPIDVTRSSWLCTWEEGGVRLGFCYIRGLREAAATALVRERSRKPFAAIEDLTRRVPELRKPELVTLAESGALNFLDPARKMHRRDALWQVERAARRSGPLLDAPDAAVEPDFPSPLSPMTTEDRLAADFRTSGVTIGPHPMAYLRDALDAEGVTRAADLERKPNGARVRVAGAVIVRQRPGTAKGFVFLSLEDETGVANAILTPQAFERARAVILAETFLLLEGRLQNQDGAVSVKVSRAIPLQAGKAAIVSHDFH
jgi:error-prone DNA polymerase